MTLSGVRLLDKKVQKSGGRFVTKVLAYMTAEDFEKAKTAVLDEETASLVHSHFSGKVGKDFAAKGGSNYTKWLRTNCATIQIDAKGGGEKAASQIERLLKKTFRNALLYRCSLESMSSVVVYNRPERSADIAAALERTGCLSLERRGSAIRVSFAARKSPADLDAYCAGMPDAGKIAVFGRETYILPSGGTHENGAGIAAAKFRSFAQRNFGLAPVNSTRKFGSFGEMKEYAESHRDEFPARWLAFCECETSAEEYGRWAYVNASVSFTLLDMETGREFASETAESAPMSAVMQRMDDAQAKSKSRAAVESACDPEKNPDANLLAVMGRVFAQIP